MNKINKEYIVTILKSQIRYLIYAVDVSQEGDLKDKYKKELDLARESLLEIEK